MQNLFTTRAVQISERFQHSTRLARRGASNARRRVGVGIYDDHRTVNRGTV
ncbi:MAG: hypothetical protein LAO04_04470 [Acidobacteriia bacterium]|nr:hypothetical protein [Terriglobia bacterium]